MSEYGSQASSACFKRRINGMVGRFGGLKLMISIPDMRDPDYLIIYRPE